MSELEKQRQRINEINTQLLSLLEERLTVAGKIADYKRENGLAVFDRKREKEVIEKARSDADPRYTYMIGGRFDSIMAMSCLYQYIKHARDQKETLDISLSPLPHKPKIGCQGVAGSYASIAASRLFPGAELYFYPRWEDLFIKVNEGELDYGVLPIENSTAGSVNAVYNLLMTNPLYINGAVTISVDHCLLVPRGCSEEKITTVHSHPQALEQCKDYLDRLGVERVCAANTAVAAMEVAKLGPGQAAIAPEECARIYGLDLKEKGIQSAAANRTRFIAVGRDKALCLPSCKGGKEKISIRFSLEDSGGNLSRVLSYFAALGLNLSKLESRPSRDDSGKYDFYLDFIESGEIGEISDFLAAAGEILIDFRFLGRYSEI